MTLRSLDMCVLGVLAIGVAACSNSPGPNAKGASRVAPLDQRCGVGPYIIPTGGTPTTERALGDRITDGKSGDVDCSVTKSGSGFNIYGSLEQGSSTFEISGSVADVGAGVYQTATPGSVGFYHPNSGNVSSTACVIEVLDNQQIGKGKAWGNFNCTNSIQEGSPGASCDFTGSFVFELCN